VSSADVKLVAGLMKYISSAPGRAARLSDRHSNARVVEY
jgi:hypothetical protein